MSKRPHYAGTRHVIPIIGTPGHARVVERGCRGSDEPYDAYFDSGGDCAHGYDWDCDTCPALPDAQPQQTTEFFDLCDREGEALP